jgi:hypothetical protein
VKPILEDIADEISLWNREKRKFVAGLTGRLRRKGHTMSDAIIIAYNRVKKMSIGEEEPGNGKRKKILGVSKQQKNNNRGGAIIRIFSRLKDGGNLGD